MMVVTLVMFGLLSAGFGPIAVDFAAT